MVWLGYTEEEVWRLTPRKWNALVSTHLDLLNKQYGVDDAPGASVKGPMTTGFIDQIGW